MLRHATQETPSTLGTKTKTAETTIPLDYQSLDSGATNTWVGFSEAGGIVYSSLLGQSLAVNSHGKSPSIVFKTENIPHV